MAELSQQLAEELSCPICLELFKEPVTTPCGHNFCGACLDETWATQGKPYRCPQCRSVYDARPELKKNTVLCAVVADFQQAEQAQASAADWTPPSGPKAPNAAIQVSCDHCLKAKAVKTCLVCTASFCEKHLRPHLENPVFRDHQLRPPIQNLWRIKCSQHNRLRDLFCQEHGECICHFCVGEHGTCSVVSLSEASADLESKLRHKLSVTYSQINGVSRALEDMRTRQQSVREAASRKMEQLRLEYMEMKKLIEASEASATRKIKEEEKRVSNQFDSVCRVLLKKKSEMQTLKEEIECGLEKGDEFEFVEKASKLQTVSMKPVYIPKLELDQGLLQGVYQGTLDLKTQIKMSLAQVQEKKLEESSSSANGAFSKISPTLRAKVLENFLEKSRPELLKYFAKVTLDLNTAHNKVALTANYTTASLAEVTENYQPHPPHPMRFTCCSQVLGLQCYKTGVHYWEVELRKSKLCGVGVSYGSIDRQGPEGRLGRNKVSWCLEWFNDKVSAWHNNIEKALPATKATRVGVLLSCDHGFIIFFAVSDKVHVMYKFRVDFTEAVYPAFWLFSVGATLSICSPK